MHCHPELRDLPPEPTPPDPLEEQLAYLRREITAARDYHTVNQYEKWYFNLKSSRK